MSISLTNTDPLGGVFVCLTERSDMIYCLTVGAQSLLLADLRSAKNGFYSPLHRIFRSLDSARAGNTVANRRRK